MGQQASPPREFCLASQFAIVSTHASLSAEVRIGNFSGLRVRCMAPLTHSDKLAIFADDQG
jgi:hypothetical protein